MVFFKGAQMFKWLLKERAAIYFQYKDEDENETGINLDDLSDEENEDDEISLSSKLSDEAAENVKAIAVENAFMEVRF